MNESSTPSLDEVLGKEIYVYQGKMYPRKHLYKTSSMKAMLIGVYFVVMLAVIGGVAAWSLGVPIAIPNFILGIEDDAPTVQVRERTLVAPAAVATTTEVEGQVEASVEGIDGVAKSSATTTNAQVQTSAEVLDATNIATTTTP